MMPEHEAIACQFAGRILPLWCASGGQGFVWPVLVLSTLC